MWPRKSRNCRPNSRLVTNSLQLDRLVRGYYLYREAAGAAAIKRYAALDPLIQGEPSCDACEPTWLYWAWHSLPVALLSVAPLKISQRQRFQLPAARPFRLRPTHRWSVRKTTW